MLNPDVTEILDDPELGGGVSFKVFRTLNVRIGGNVRQTVQEINATGNIQPENKSSQSSTVEDLLSESIVVYTRFIFQTGSNEFSEFTEPDEILYHGNRYRITSINNWEDWGFTIAHAERVRGYKVLPVENGG